MTQQVSWPNSIKIGNTTIYLLSGAMPPPSALIPSLITEPNSRLYSLPQWARIRDCRDEISAQRGTTVMVPGNDEFASLGLFWSYLSLPNDDEAHGDLARVIKSHVLKDVIYSDSFDNVDANDEKEKVILAHTLNDHTMVRLSKAEDGSVHATVVEKSGSDHQKDFGDRTLLTAGSNSAKVHLRDKLFQSGVAHQLTDGVLIPPNVHITSHKLLRGMQADSFVELLDRFGLLGTLDGSLANKTLDDGSSDNNSTTGILGYLLLVPNDKALWDVPAYREYVRREHEEFAPATTFLANDNDNPWRNRSQEVLEQYLNQTTRLHIIPIYNNTKSGDNLPSTFRLEDREHYPTLLDGIGLLAHEYSPGKFSLQLYDPSLLSYPNSPFRLPPYLFLATIMRGSNSETGGVYELDVALPVPDIPPTSGTHGWKAVLWNGLVWVLGISITGGLVSALGYWVQQWRRQDGYEPL